MAAQSIRAVDLPAARGRPFTALLISTVLVGCGADEPIGATPAITRSDSPSVRIGVLNGDPEYQFHRVRAVRRLAGSRIVVADAGTRLRIYDGSGRYIRTVGRNGGGPGEFRSIDQLVALDGDSIVVQDRRADRVTVFGPDGELVRTFAFEPRENGRRGMIAGVLGTGEFLLYSGRSWRPGETEPGFRREPVAVFLADREGHTIQDIGTFRGYERYFEAQQGSTSSRLTVTTGLFARGSEFAAGEDRVYVGDTAVPQIAVYDRTGTVVDTLDTGLPVRPTDDEGVAALVEERLKAYRDPNRRRDAKRRYEAMPYPETLPVYDGFVIDPFGLAWVREYRIRRRDPAIWRIYTHGSQSPAVIQFPAGFTVSHVGDDFVAGVWLDSLDVPYVWMFRLDRE
jgi:hypothetical protein